ncbi:MAG: proline--tRNA ligase [bacterium]|nr:proline--tRNA ligase [bacterium]
MKYSKIFPKTMRNDPKDAPSAGTRLLLRGGFIRQVGAGLWMMTPLGLMVQRLIENIVREEMNRAGATEIELPILQPREFWEKTGRWEKYKKQGLSFVIKDRKNSDYIMAPTAEEVITDFAAENLQSWRDLPANYWQIRTKFRDELRPRQGLIRGREFLMKDAYSFDADEEGMKESFEKMNEAYGRIFKRCDFDFIKVEADSGTIGGSGSAEFMALSETGEDTLLYCSKCGYGGNQEKALAGFEYLDEEFSDLKKVKTPGIKTVKQLENALGLPATKIIKTLVFLADGKPVIVSLRGDLEVNEVALANAVGAEKIEVAPEVIVKKITGAPVGFAGPVELFKKTETPYFLDYSLAGLKNFACGANEGGFHYVNTNIGRDFPDSKNSFWHLSKAIGGMLCGNCRQDKFEEKRGIELGHIFQLQQVYSKPMGAGFLDEKGQKKNFWMGCYGIGISRMVQAIVEQKNDEIGIIWPAALAPFQVVVIPAKETDFSEAEKIYEELRSHGYRVLFDDRDERIGVKFTDAELLGWPFQIVVGRDWEKDKKLEVRDRENKNAASPMTVGELESFLNSQK